MPDAIKSSDLSAHPSSAQEVSASSAASESSAATSEDDFRATIAHLRDVACERARPAVKAGAAPIRVMARMVNDLIAECRAAGIPEAIIASEVINRTIGDIDVRRISATDDGPRYVSLADDMGLALPGEVFDGGYVAKGRTYRWIQRRMQEIERELLAERIDLRIYDLSGIGALRLREALAGHAQRAWGISFPAQQIHASLGSTDGLCKLWMGLIAAWRAQGMRDFAIFFPTPGFNVPEWQAVNMGARSVAIHTRAEDHFKVTPATLAQALDNAPDARAIYLTISNNPTAFAYTPDEIRALYRMLDERGSDLIVVADLAYIGTGDPAADRERMRALTEPNARARSAYAFTFSKSHTLTGDRLGWVALGTPELAQTVAVGWSNTAASLPADWQLRYMALIELFARRPRVEARARALYRMRRARLIRQLQALSAARPVPIFADISMDDGGTIYNWSQLAPGEDVFSFFSMTGIAGVPGSAFGYSDDYVRLSVGCIPVPEV